MSGRLPCLAVMMARMSASERPPPATLLESLASLSPSTPLSLAGPVGLGEYTELPLP